jgi:peptidyl-prolyl cis-trans isomerase SurA
LKRALRTFVLSFAALGASGATLAQQAPAPFSSLQPAPAAQAQGGMAIAAVVNEDIITLFDVQSRTALFITTSGIEDSAEMRQRLTPQVIDVLIDDRLKLQEAAKQKIVITEREVADALLNVEQRNGMQEGALRQMLASRNIDIGTLNSQMEAEIAWGKVVRQSLQQEVNVSPEEVNAVLARARANQGKAEYLVAEISLPVLSPAQDAVMRDMASQLVTQARGGAPFPNLAQQFSQSATAALGGDLGWMVQGEMEPELDAAIARMQPNQVSDPLRTANGYHILMLRDKRTAGTPDPSRAVVSLNQIYLPTVGKRALPAARIAELTDSIGKLADCTQMDKVAKELKTPGSGPIPPVYVGGLPDRVRAVVADLKPGKTSPVIEVGGAKLLLQVCMRRDDSGVPSGDQIRGNLENDKLQTAARQKLRDLRRAALIDIRL